MLKSTLVLIGFFAMNPSLAMAQSVEIQQPGRTIEVSPDDVNITKTINHTLPKIGPWPHEIPSLLDQPTKSQTFNVGDQSISLKSAPGAVESSCSVANGEITVAIATNKPRKHYNKVEKLFKTICLDTDNVPEKFQKFFSN